MFESLLSNLLVTLAGTPSHLFRGLGSVGACDRMSDFWPPYEKLNLALLFLL